MNENISANDIINQFEGYKELDGYFELHVTIESSDVNQFDQFIEFCENCRKINYVIKPILIELPSGENPRQVMTSSWKIGHFAEVFDHLKQIEKLLIFHGYKLLRSKIEALASSKGVPKTSDDLRNFDPSNYFEFHTKVKIPDEKMPQLEDLAQLASLHGARLSSNGLKKTEPLFQSRFVNLRVFDCPREETVTINSLLVKSLLDADWTV